jgi:hypothetical protein
MTVADDMQTFRALSYGDKWRVNRSVAKGEAPQDPRMAAAAVELIESHQYKRRTSSNWRRWVVIIAAFVGGATAILSAIDGDLQLTICMAFVAVTNAGQLLVNPLVARPRDLARSLEASRQVLAEGS